MFLLLNKAIGILGGTFDPVHLGHINLASKVLQEIELSEIRFIPCFKQAHKDIIATVEARLAMLELAIVGQPKFRIDSREIKRQGISYMLDTLKSLRQELPNTPLCFIMSIDAFAKFTAWHRWREIIEFAHLIVADRPGFSLQGITSELNTLIEERQADKAEFLYTNLAGYIFFVKIAPLQIAAHEVRDLIRAGKSAEHLLPSEVWQYILQNSLYK
jgi:nicotinate-nucleotide adenylyltransferase